MTRYPFFSGHCTKKYFGQHFLHDRHICQRIVEALDIQPKDNILEIGPGRGALTEHICKAEKKNYLAVERDKDLIFFLKKKYPQLILAAGDALALKYEGFAPGWKIIGNLPYNIASPLMWELFSRTKGLSRAVFMVQKEVGERLVAKPGTKTYGALSVWVQSFVLPKLLFTVGTGSFHPKPKVNSAVLSFTPIKTEEFSLPLLSQFIKKCFQNRRKQLRTLLKPHSSEKILDILDKNGLGPNVRPEEIAPHIFRQLSCIIKHD